MAKAKPADTTTGEGMTLFESRLTNLLGLMLIQERKQAEQIALLDRSGFRNTEIAALLGTTPNTVSVVMYQQRSKKPKTPKKANKRKR